MASDELMEWLKRIHEPSKHNVAEADRFSDAVNVTANGSMKRSTKLKNKTKLTAEEIAYCRENFKKVPTDYIYKKLGISYATLLDVVKKRRNYANL